MNISSRDQLLWVSGAGVLGLGCSAIFSARLHWSRAAFVLAYSVLVAAFLIALGAYMLWARVAGGRTRTSVSPAEEVVDER